MSVSRIIDVSFDKLYIFDSTTIRLFSEIMKVLDQSQNMMVKKGGLNFGKMIDANSYSAKFVKISEAKQHYKNFLKQLILIIGSIIVFDKAYNHYFQFAQWS